MRNDIFLRYPELRGKPAEMAMFCALLRDRGLHADALAIGAAAVAAAPQSLAILSEVTTNLSRGIPTYHSAMMLDHARNAAYARAIEQVVQPDMLVLEIGAGSGLLAMLAARAGAQVVTCEGHPMVAAAAQTIVARNGFADRVKIIAKRSNELRIPDDLPRQADLVIHEIFGSQLFDEGVNDALTDARHRLLKPGAPSLPSGAAIRCALAQAPATQATATLADVYGFDLSHFALLVRPTRRLFADERAGLELLSEAKSGLHMDYDLVPPFGAVSETIRLTSNGGRVDGLAQWIEIRFADGTIHDNMPFRDAPNSSWAAVYQPFPQPIETLPGDGIDVTLRHRGLMVTFDVVHQAIS